MSYYPFSSTPPKYGDHGGTNPEKLHQYRLKTVKDISKDKFKQDRREGTVWWYLNLLFNPFFDKNKKSPPK